MQKTVNSNQSLVLFNPSVEPLSDATTPSQSGPGSDGNEGVLRIPQSFSITGTLPSDCLRLVSFLCLMAYQPFIGYFMPKPFS